MSKKNSKDSGGFPVEFPSRNKKFERSPITDVVENEIFPFDVNTRHHSGVQIESFDDLTEVIATEIEPDTEGQTTREQ